LYLRQACPTCACGTVQAGSPGCRHEQETFCPSALGIPPTVHTALPMKNWLRRTCDDRDNLLYVQKNLLGCPKRKSRGAEYPPPPQKPRPKNLTLKGASRQVSPAALLISRAGVDMVSHPERARGDLSGLCCRKYKYPSGLWLVRHRMINGRNKVYTLSTIYVSPLV